jgi:hypothetical protein
MNFVEMDAARLFLKGILQAEVIPARRLVLYTAESGFRQGGQSLG